MPVNEELRQGGLVRVALRGGQAGLEAQRLRERVGDETAQYVAGANLHKVPDAVVIPESLDIVHPMDGRFQVGHQNTPDLSGIRWIRCQGCVGDDGNLRGMKWDGGNKRLELIMDDPHDRRVESHADTQDGESVSLLLQSGTEIFDHLGVATQDDLGR